MTKFFAPATEVKDSAFIEDIAHYRQESNGKAGFNVEAVFFLVENFLKFVQTMFVITYNMVMYWANFKMADFNNATVTKVQGDINNLKKRLERDSYLSMSGVLVPCPDGFNGDFPGYVNTLSASSASVFDTAFKMSDELQLIVTEFVNNKSSRLSVREYTITVEKARKVREEQEKSFLTNFSTGSNQRLRFDKMFETKQEVIPTMEKTVKLYKEVSKYNPETIKARVNELSKRIEMVLEIQKKASKEERVASKAAFLAIAEYTLEVARQMEHIGKFMVRTEMAFVASSNMAQRLTSDK